MEVLAPLPAWMGVSGFVDIHCHALPGLDDGPRDGAAARSLVEAAARAGTAAIVATPHFNFQYDYWPDAVEALLAQVERECPSAPLLFRGCELELNDEATRAFFAEPRRYTLNGSRYALVEPPLRFPPDRLAPLLARFRATGVTPVLAHPERVPLFQERPELAAAWVSAGGLLQITGCSFLGRMGRRAEALAWDLLGAGLAAFVSSDAHDAAKRPPDLRPAFRAVYDRAGQAAAARLFTHNPAAVVHDEPVETAG